MSKTSGFDTNVFINCPFDSTYTPLLRSVIFTVLACGFTPLSALQERDAGTIRLDKIKKLIKSSRLGIHDISRTEPDKDSGLPRFNMPFELGLDLGAREYGRGQLATKQILILDKERYRYQKFLSDIAGQDISAHNAVPSTAIEKVRGWPNSLRTAGAPPLLGAARIVKLFDTFSSELVAICVAADLDEKNLDFNDLLYFTGQWVELNA